MQKEPMARDHVWPNRRVREELEISRGGLRAMVAIAAGLVVVYAVAAVLLFL